MITPPLPLDEAHRLATLRSLYILDTPPEERFDRITRLASRTFNVPIALVSLIDSDRQWFKSCFGISVSETSRDISFCGHAILNESALVIPDTLLEPRFADNPLVTDEPKIRFYAGQPLIASNGTRLGTLCIIDSQPRIVTQADLATLRDLAILAQNELNNLQLNQAINVLRESETRLHTILNNIPDGIITLSAKGNINWLNQAAEQMTGYSSSNLVGKELVEICALAAQRERYRTILNHYINGKNYGWGKRLALTALRADGSQFPVEIMLIQLPLGNDEVQLGVYICDISERTRAEEARLETEGRYQRLIRDLQVGVILHGPQTEILLCNATACALLGLTEEQLRGKSSFDLAWNVIHEDGTPFAPERHPVSEALKLRQPVHGVVMGVYRPVTQDRVWLLVSAEPQLNRDGKVEQVTVTFSDITKRKQAEEALRTSEIRHRALVNALPDTLVRVSRNGTILDYKRSSAVGHYSPDIEHVGKNLSDILPPHVLQITMLNLERTLQTGTTQVYELYDEQKSQIIELEIRTVLAGEDEVLLVLRDITERKKVERVKNEFISMVSHELRTPLTSIRGSLGLIAGGVAGEISPRAKTMIDIAYNNCERLTRLINDILDVEKIESGKMSFNLRPLELLPLIEQSLIANQPYADQYDVSFKFDQRLEGVKVNADSDRLLQVLANLLSNAAKFSPAGGTITISVSPCGPFVRVAISDQGSGIPEDFQRRIFQKFAQADSSDTRRRGGTGLGLSISKAIVERLGGQIGFEATVGSGTTFYFDLPEWQMIEALELAKPVPAKRPQVLVCEDDADIAALLSLILYRSGFNPLVAHSLAEARVLLANQAFDVMTLDLLLPDGDGIAFLRELRTQEKTLNLPVVVVSICAEEGRQQLNGKTIAVIDWIEKPINPARLAAAVQLAAYQVLTKPRILHIEDDPDILQVTSAILQEVAEVTQVTNLKAASEQLIATNFDLVILDVELGYSSGLDFLPLLNILGRNHFPVVFSADELNAESAHQVAAALVKSRTSNQQLLATIEQLITRRKKL